MIWEWIDSVSLFCSRSDFALSCLSYSFFVVISLTACAFYLVWRFALKQLWVKFWNSELKPVLQYVWAWWIYDLDMFQVCCQTILLLITIAVSIALAFWFWPSDTKNLAVIAWIIISFSAFLSLIAKPLFSQISQGISTPFGDAVLEDEDRQS